MRPQIVGSMNRFWNPTKLDLYGKKDLHRTSMTAFNSPLEDTAFLQQFNTTGVGRESTQEEEVMLAECVEEAIAL